MRTRELIEALQAADPNGYREVCINKVRKIRDDTVTTRVEIIGIENAPPSELNPVVLELFSDY